MKLCIVQPKLDNTSETFFQAHASKLPFQTTVIYFNESIPYMNDSPILSQSFFQLGMRKITRLLRGKQWNWEITSGLKRAFRNKADVILAEYGPTGVMVLESAELTRIPLVVHFHGFDASVFELLERHKEDYQQLFKKCAKIVVVSNKMKSDLIQLGADENKITLNPCGVDTEHFVGAQPEKQGPVFLTVGRFVEKKAPYLNIVAFAKVVAEHPEARLRMIGSGPLLGICKDLVFTLGLSDSVKFLGECTHDQVKEEMLKARAYIQHSIQASDGDCEGTPVSVMEAQSIGLPVISTRHAGIVDVVDHDDTGFLVDEKDVNGMADYMIKVIEDRELSSRMGYSGRQKIKNNYSMKKSIDRLAAVINEAAATGRPH